MSVKFIKGGWGDEEAYCVLRVALGAGVSPGDWTRSDLTGLWLRRIPLAGGLLHSRSVGLTAFAIRKSFSQLPKLLKSQAAQVDYYEYYTNLRYLCYLCSKFENGRGRSVRCQILFAQRVPAVRFAVAFLSTYAGWIFCLKLK